MSKQLLVDVRTFDVIGGFPNPAIDHFIIQYGNDVVSEIDFRVYDMLGNLVFSNNHNSIIGYNEIVFDTSKLFSGIYTFTLSNNSELITERILVK